MRASVRLSWLHTREDEAGLTRRAMLRQAVLEGGAVLVSLECTVWCLYAAFGDAASGWGVRVLLAGMSLAAIGVGGLVAAFAARGAARRSDWRYGPTQVDVDRRGVIWRGEEGVSAWRWRAVARCERSAGGLWITLRDGHRRWAPARALSPGDADAVAALRASPEEAGDDYGPPRPAAGVLAAEGVWTAAHWSAALPSVARLRGLREQWVEWAALLLVCNLVMGPMMGLDRLLVWMVSVVVLAWMSGLQLLGRLRAWGATLAFRRAIRRDPAGAPLGPFALVAGPDGLWVRSSHGARWCAWAPGQVVTPRPEILLLRLSGGSIVVVPRACLPDPDAFLAQVQGWIAAAGERAGGGPPPGRGAADDANPFAAPGGGRYPAARRVHAVGRAG